MQANAVSRFTSAAVSFATTSTRIAVLFFAAICFAASFGALSGTSALAQDSAQSVVAGMPIGQPLITEAIDESQLTRLKGNTHPLARPQYDLGTAPATLPMERMLLVLKRSDAQEYALRTLLDDQQDKESPNYHKWLTPEQFGKTFGPSDADMQTIVGWLQSHGFQVAAPSKGRTVIEFSGSASQVQEAFHTTIHKYLVNGEQHWANASDPSIPTALTPAVAGVYSLHNFVKKPMYRLGKEKGTIQPGKPPQITFTSGAHGVAPADYAIIYNINPLYNATPIINGNGVSIGVVGRSDIQLSDIANFQGMFGAGQTPQVIVNGPDPGDVPGDDLEATLDVSWSGAVAPGAQVFFVNSASTDTTDGVVLSEAYIIENNLTDIMTYSFGGCEFRDGEAALFDQALAEQAAAQGISFFASTGDAGAEGCDNPNFETVAIGPLSVNLPASTPFTTAVGGTEFSETAGGGSDSNYWNPTSGANGVSVMSYIPEVVWNDSCSSCANPNIAADGGGESTGDISNGGTFGGFARPSYQAGVFGSPTADGQRNVPDVSLTASNHDGYVLCFQGSCAQGGIFVIGGTSASTPSFAGIMALVDQKMSLTPNGSVRQGLANYVLYPLAAAQHNAGTSCNASVIPALPASSGCVFNDVTVGNNAVPDTTFTSTLYPATAGYDPATGLGSVNVTNLVDHWASIAFRPTTTTLLPTSPTTITHGHNVNFQITVKPTNGPTTPAPGGDVALIAEPSGSPSNQTSTLDCLATTCFTLNAGVASVSTGQLPGGQLPGGTYAVHAHYAGNSTNTATGVFVPSDSNAVMVTVSKEGSTTTMSQATLDNNGNPVALPQGTSVPFGTGVFVRADVVGTSGNGIPTGLVTFKDNNGTTPLPGSILGPVANPVALNSAGSTSIGASLFNNGVVNYDAGNHSISASYAGDASFAGSSSTAATAFTILAGFAGVNGPTNVVVNSPGLSGGSTVGIVASTGFTTAVSITCTGGLPTGAACAPLNLTPNGPNTVVNGTLTVTTTGTARATAQHSQTPYYFAVVLGGGLPLAGIFLLSAPRRRRWSVVGALMLLALLIGLPACGGGGSHSTPPPQNPTPPGTYQITITASANGAPSLTGSFFLVVK